ncbi:MAG: hypothetical protein AAFW74_14815 [Pseudomonadota bacterium]
MSKIIDLAEYRDVTPKEDEIRLPEDGFISVGLSLCGESASGNDLVSAHKWFSLAAMRGSRQARVHRLEVSCRMDGDQIARAQSELHSYVSARLSA